VRFIKLEENTLVLKMYKATRGVVIFSSAGVVTHDRRIAPGRHNLTSYSRGLQSWELSFGLTLVLAVYLQWQMAHAG
jgi:hypothetical protein